jgi:branched-chain amino acid transport system substrate-binding protein
VALALLLPVLLAAAAGCGGSGEKPVRVGVVVDCQGAFRALRDRELSGAQLPLIARGATERGSEPSDGVTSARVAGRPVELVPACSESGAFATVTQAVRLLVERAHVAAVVVGGAFSIDGLALRTIARRYPTVPFVAAANGPREVTLAPPAASVYRVAADYGQSVAGLATYAYRQLGWRRAAVVTEGWVAGWDAETAFVSEFCALGGRIAKRVGLVPGAPADQPKGIPRDVDGVAVLASMFSVAPPYLQRLAQQLRDPARRMVLGTELTAAPDLLAPAGRSLDGVVGATYTPPATADARAFARAYAKAWPGSPASAARDPLVVNYRNGVEAVIQALEGAHGAPRALRAALARLRTRLLGVPAQMDAHGQAVVSSTLVRLGAQPVTVATIPGVDQSIGGLVAPGYVPTDAGQRCRRAPAPPWSR